ncbi:hypothetical protein CDAR_50941 [Caerostris darwini]|uniref:Uncharacterized protein n=1 Tax=Caerostris darwini TaxID=1538125 RepID=A0AAV4U5Z5_9ARAC|nr:hypothetical protein CDAR_50941 [Caerostris darwini]
MAQRVTRIVPIKTVCWGRRKSKSTPSTLLPPPIVIALSPLSPSFSDNYLFVAAMSEQKILLLKTSQNDSRVIFIMRLGDTENSIGRIFSF